MQSWNVLDTPEIMCMLLPKLSGGRRDKWSWRVLLTRRKQGKEPELADFIDFVDDENLAVGDPVFSEKAVEQYIDKNTKSRRVATYVSGSKEKSVDLTEFTMYKLWRKSSIGRLPEVYGHGFEGQNQLLIKEKVLFWMFATNEATTKC